MSSSVDDPPHIAALAFPFATHAAPLMSLVMGLAAKIPEAEISFLSTAESNASVFSGLNGIIHNIKPRNVYQGFPAGHAFSDDPREPVEMFLRSTPGNFVEALESAVKESGRRVTCLVSDAFFWFAADLAESLGVPWVPLWTASPWSVLLHVETDRIRRSMNLYEPEKMVPDEFLPGMSTIRVKDLPEGVARDEENSEVTNMLHKMGQTLPRASALAINSFEALSVACVRELQSRLKNVFNVGPFVMSAPSPIVADPHGCLDWLTQQADIHSVVYISFGSVINLPPHELEALAQALEESGISFLWIVKGPLQEMLPRGFLDRTKGKGKVVEWAPQFQVLKHEATGAFFTHSGWNSVMESMAGGVPMICRPFFADQPLNARIVEFELKIGTTIDGGAITKDSAVKAMKLVLSSIEGRNMRNRANELSSMAYDAAKPNGSSLVNFDTLSKITAL